MPEELSTSQIVFFIVLATAIFCGLLYFIIKLSVKHAILEVDEKRKPKT